MIQSASEKTQVKLKIFNTIFRYSLECSFNMFSHTCAITRERELVQVGKRVSVGSRAIARDFSLVR